VYINLVVVTSNSKSQTKTTLVTLAATAIPLLMALTYLEETYYHKIHSNLAKIFFKNFHDEEAVAKRAGVYVELLTNKIQEEMSKGDEYDRSERGDLLITLNEMLEEASAAEIAAGNPEQKRRRRSSFMGIRRGSVGVAAPSEHAWQNTKFYQQKGNGENGGERAKKRAK